MTQRALAVDVVDGILTSEPDASRIAERILDRLEDLGWRAPPEIRPRSASPIQTGYDLALLGVGLLITFAAAAAVVAAVDSFGFSAPLWLRLAAIASNASSILLIVAGLLAGPRSLYRGRADR